MSARKKKQPGAGETPDPGKRGFEDQNRRKDDVSIEKSSSLTENQAGNSGREELGTSDHPKDADVPESALQQKIPFPVVGIGASAGGLEALEEFFQNVPSSSGMAYVVISHTDPGRSSLLPEIIRRKSNIPVIEVVDGMAVEPNTVYLPPSNRDLVLEDNTFRLQEQQRGSSLRLPIDTFLKSLANSRGEQTCCVIVSGTGTDGTQGLRIIKEKGGVTVVQSTDSARYEGMPVSAISTGLADLILRPSEMPGRIAEYFSSAGAVLEKPQEMEDNEQFPVTLSKIVTTISNRVGHDFSAYKKSTLVRRIQRRMTVTRMLSPQKYLNYLYHNPGEIESLFQDLLIGVTSFFRDPEAFDYLERNVLPDLLTRRPENEPFRVWASGCATGEEVYSIVISIVESLEQLGIRKELQVFGTDLDRSAIDKAREGLYPENIAADVSPERLKRFFEKENSSYRVRKSVREPIVFAVHNVLKDPPFSRLDLMVCRNLLIYLESAAQKKILPLFHYAIKPEGVLFLGTSETVGEFSELFTPIHKKWSLYRRADVSPALQPLIEFPTGSKGAAVLDRVLQTQNTAEIGDVAVAEATARLLLEMHTPPCAVVNRRGEITYIHGRTGKFLEPAAGRMSVNIVDMAREGLRFELASALRKVASTSKSVRKEGIRVKTNGDFVDFDLTVIPFGKPESLKNMMAVIFEEIPQPKKKGNSKKAGSSVNITQRTIDLEREVAKVQQDHRIAMEELETSNEELKSVNEELQSSNEELQSTNEELESSREELQSLNEELSTVNAELHEKILELSQSYETINHVLNATGVAILFVDRELNVLRFTRDATKLINLIDADIGRPLTHISTNLDYDSLLDDVHRAISEVKVVEANVRTREGRPYSIKVVPYRDLKGMVSGAVITFLNLERLVDAKMLQEEAGE